MYVFPHVKFKFVEFIFYYGFVLNVCFFWLKLFVPVSSNFWLVCENPLVSVLS